MTAADKIRVLVVEDSPTVRQLLVHILNADPALQVIATATDGEQAIEMTKLHRPHVITMDLHMPRMNGIDAVRIIMETVPTPIVIVSGDLAPAALEETFLALTTGALAVIEKPAGLGGIKAAHLASNLVQTVKLMSEIKVVRRWPKAAQSSASLPNGQSKAALSPQRSFLLTALDKERADIQLVVIGASTGGPLVLHSILTGVAGNLSVPIAIVQHIATGFTDSFADWLSKSSGIPVHVAVAGQQLLPGHAYIAPDGKHMGIKSGLRITLQETLPENGHRPAVGHLFRSTATVLGGRAVGVLLSGMGKDGAAELKLMAEQGAVTIVQDPFTTVVPGMPGEAIKLGAAMYVLAPEKIVAALLKLIEPASVDCTAQPPPQPTPQPSR